MIKETLTFICILEQTSTLKAYSTCATVVITQGRDFQTNTLPLSFNPDMAPKDPSTTASSSGLAGSSSASSVSASSSSAKSASNGTRSKAVIPVRAPRSRRQRIPDKPNIPISLWSIVKNSIGKDLTKIPIPVNFSEPLSFLQV